MLTELFVFGFSFLIFYGIVTSHERRRRALRWLGCVVLLVGCVVVVGCAWLIEFVFVVLISLSKLNTDSFVIHICDESFKTFIVGIF